MIFFMSGLSSLLSKEGKIAMLIGDMDIERLMVHVQQVKEDNLRERKDFQKRGLR